MYVKKGFGGKKDNRDSRRNLEFTSMIDMDKWNCIVFWDKICSSFYGGINVTNCTVDLS